MNEWMTNTNSFIVITCVLSLLVLLLLLLCCCCCYLFLLLLPLLLYHLATATVIVTLLFFIIFYKRNSLHAVFCQQTNWLITWCSLHFSVMQFSLLLLHLYTLTDFTLLRLCFQVFLLIIFVRRRSYRIIESVSVPTVIEKKRCV